MKWSILQLIVPVLALKTYISLIFRHSKQFLDNYR